MENPDTGQQVPSGTPKLTGIVKYKKQLIIGLVIVFVLAIGGYMGVRSRHKKPIIRSAKDDPTQIVKPVTPPAPTEGYEKVVYDADQLFVKGDYDATIKLLEAKIPETKDKEQLFTIQEKIGKAYRAKSDWQNAIKWLEQAQATGGKYANSLYPVIAEMAEKIGDKPKAIADYKKAYELLASNKDPVAQRIAATYQDKIKALGGS